MIKRKSVWFMPCAVAVLTACGGGSSPESKSELESDAVVIRSVDGENVKKSSWIDISQDTVSYTKSYGAGTDLEGVSIVSSKKALDKESADGVFLDVEKLSSDWKETVKKALKDGQVIVLKSTGDKIGEAKVHDRSVEAFGSGVKAAAVMVYQEVPNSEAFVMMPFDLGQMKDLSNLMTAVSRRSSSQVGVVSVNDVQ